MTAAAAVTSGFFSGITTTVTVTCAIVEWTRRSCVFAGITVLVIVVATVCCWWCVEKDRWKPPAPAPIYENGLARKEA